MIGLAALVLAGTASAATQFVNGGFDNNPNDLWGQPSGWPTPTWSGCNQTYGLPASGPWQFFSGTTPCGSSDPTNVNINQGCPYVRVVSGYTFPYMSQSLWTVHDGPYACELFSSSPAAVCQPATQYASISQSVTFLPPQTEAGQCVSGWYAAVFQRQGLPPSTDPYYHLEIFANGNSWRSWDVHSDSPNVQYGGYVDADGNDWWYLPWQPFPSMNCIPPGYWVTIQAEVFSSTTQIAPRWCFGYLDSVQVVNCCPKTSTPTETYTPSCTGTISLTPTITCTPTPTASVTETFLPTSSDSPVFTPTPTAIGQPIAPYLRLDKNLYTASGNHAYVTAQWLTDRDLDAEIHLYNSAGEEIAKVFSDIIHANQVGEVTFSLTSLNGHHNPQPLASGVYALRLVGANFRLTARFAIVRGATAPGP